MADIAEVISFGPTWSFWNSTIRMRYGTVPEENYFQ
jgi:hypothetical protein